MTRILSAWRMVDGRRAITSKDPTANAVLRFTSGKLLVQKSGPKNGLS
jgi:hypothetical protein